MRTQNWSHLFLGAYLILGIVSPAVGDYIMAKDVLTIAGGQVSSTSYLLGFSIGQTVVGWSSSCNYAEWGGFWGWTSREQPIFVTEEAENISPSNYLLRQNYPNPFNPRTNISYQISRFGHVSLDIYNVKGQLVIRLVDDIQAPGEHFVAWDGTDQRGALVSSGVYFYRLATGSFQQVRKMLLLK